MAKKRRIDMVTKNERIAWNILEAKLMFLEEAMDSMDKETVSMAIGKMLEAMKEQMALYEQRRQVLLS